QAAGTPPDATCDALPSPTSRGVASMYPRRANMPRAPIAQTLGELETLAKSITEEVKADAPQLERAHLRLQAALEEIKKLLVRRDFYHARKQEATRKAQDRLRRARMTGTFLRKGLIVHYGPDNEQLSAFDIKPFRGRKRAKKTQGSP